MNILSLVNGSVHNIKPSLHKKNIPMEHVKKMSGHYKNEEIQCSWLYVYGKRLFSN